MRASLGQRVLGLEHPERADGATLTRPQAVRRWLFLFGIVAVASALQSPCSTTSLGTLGSPDRAPGVRVRDLPAVDDLTEPEEAGLPRRPGRDRRRQAAPDPPPSSRTGPASPAPFSRVPRARSRACGRGAAGTPRAAAGRTRRPAGSTRRSAVATRSASASRGRCSAASGSSSAARARSSVVGGTRRIASATSDCSDGLGRLRRRARAGAAGRARPSPSAPEQQRLVGTRANQATAARWLRSAASAAATTADGSSRIATRRYRSPARRPASRRAS